MSRCLLVSNRLPVTYNPLSKSLHQSSGGLVSALKNLDSKKVGFDFKWLGVMNHGHDIHEKDLLALKDKQIISPSISLEPVTVPSHLYDLYYNQYCNEVLWPLFHYERNMVHHNSKARDAYIEVNHIMAENILQHVHSSYDILWIHDFHFFLIPGIIKKKRPDLKVGFFLHIPFPSSEILRELPEKEMILKSLFMSDQVGFHHPQYLTNFKESLAQMRSTLLRKNSLRLNQQHKHWKAYPISIDAHYFHHLSIQEKSQKFVHKYSQHKRKTQWILGIDRLDYTKGILLKLKIFKNVLMNSPELHKKIQLVQVIIPSRTSVSDYQNLKNQIEQLISRINGEFGSPDWMPINYLYHSISPHELSALYQMSEILFVTSRRDGMNLVSLEYVMSQKKNEAGCVVLSEFAGAHYLLENAYKINPWDIQNSSLILKMALLESADKKNQDIKKMQQILLNYDSTSWAQNILKDLKSSQTNDQEEKSLIDITGRDHSNSIDDEIEKTYINQHQTFYH